jgi:RNA polymerase sigma factor (sigma-70 family)
MTAPQQASWHTLLAALAADVARHEPGPDPRSSHEEETWRELERRLKPIAEAVSRRFDGAIASDELVQDVLVRLQNGSLLQRVSGARQPLAYFFSLLRRVALDKLRQANRASARMQQLSDLSDVLAAPDLFSSGERPAWVSPQRVKRLREEMARLKPQDQLLLRRRFVENLRTGEIAAEVGMSYAAVAQRLHRLLRSLRDALQGVP